MKDLSITRNRQSYLLLVKVRLYARIKVIIESKFAFFLSFLKIFLR